MKRKTISIIIPVYNEAAGIRRFLEGELFPVMQELPYLTELIIVDDGSKDKSLEIVRESLKNQDAPTRVISFTRNFGKEIALTAGLKYAKNEAVIMLDSDGQHPVSVIPKMLEKWEKGAKIVTVVNSGNNTKHKFGSKMFYGTMRLMGNHTFREGAMDFRLLDRVVVEEYNKLTEHNRITRGLIDWLGYPQEYIKASTLKRASGRPTYSRKKLMGLAVDSFVSMSSTPLLIFGYIGLFIIFTSLPFGLFILVEQYIMGDPMRLDWSGAVAMSVFVSFLVGLVLLSQSITALYIARIHAETKGRPLYIIDKEKSSNIEVGNAKK
ncbi:glycosyltransferase [Candidatus Saccharibacteria bacterium]|nr:glycosyltransferase [Candidatus Saccharibacteria bacterium]